LQIVADSAGAAWSACIFLLIPLWRARSRQRKLARETAPAGGRLYFSVNFGATELPAREGWNTLADRSLPATAAVA
jgi:hypothetical protein